MAQYPYLRRGSVSDSDVLSESNMTGARKQCKPSKQFSTVLLLEHCNYDTLRVEIVGVAPNSQKQEIALQAYIYHSDMRFNIF